MHAGAHVLSPCVEIVSLREGTDWPLHEGLLTSTVVVAALLGYQHFFAIQVNICSFCEVMARVFFHLI